MKNYTLTLLASVVVISFSTPVFAESKHSGHAMHQEVKISKKIAKIQSVIEYRAVMKSMHEGMAIEYSGDADIDFVRGMIPHHQGAVDMAKIQLKYGKDEKLKELSRRIILAQEEEIGFMRNWLRGRDIGLKSADAKTVDSTIAFEKSMVDMHKNMAIAYTGDADIDFARGMIPHHQGAIDMAWILKEHGSNVELRPMLDDIIRSQSQEIEMMKEWLESNNFKK
jgi:uncharacterized protein (DUF305 family)